MLSRSFRLLTALIPLGAALAMGMTPRLVKDINTLTYGDSSSPSDFVTVGGVTYFAATDGDTGRELWRTDGTAAGTYRLADACAGECYSNPKIIAFTDRSIFFVAAGEREGYKDLWVSSGTPASTLRLTEPPVRPGQANILLSWVSGQHLLYFAADDGIHGTELWRSDGTPAGTYQVVDLRPGSFGSSPQGLTELQGHIYFSADDGQRGPMLWKSDGTPQGTKAVRDPLPNSASHVGPRNLRVVGGTLFFVAPAPGMGTELWKSDGTTRGTAPLIDLVQGAGSTFFYDFTVFRNRLLFVAEVSAQGQELWTTDGTARGTRPLTNFPRSDAFGYSNGDFLKLPRVYLGTRMVFAANDGPHGVELWISDGTAKGTRLIQDVCPGICSGVTDSGLVSGNRVYFSGLSSVHGKELWVTDGTSGGTRIIGDLCRGSCGAEPSGLINAGGKVFFAARNVVDGVRNLWRTDGTGFGIVRLTNFPEDRGLRNNLLATALGSSLVFRGEDEHGSELWRSDGSAAGTQLLADVNTRNIGGSFPRDLTAAGNRVFFFASDDGLRSALFKSDGTEAGTSFVYDFSLANPYPTELTASAFAASKLFLVLSFQNKGTSLWSTDGTESGTVRLTPEGVRPGVLCAVGDIVFFTASDENYRGELWRTDGTAAGTVLVQDFVSGRSGPENLTAFKSRLYFAVDTLGEGYGLWVSDGTAAGTVLLKDVNPLHYDLCPLQAFTEFAGRLWFLADDGELSCELWSTDGTPAGTILSAESMPGSGSLFLQHLLAAGTRLFSYGAGLVVSDGTAAGTQRISSVRFDHSAPRPVVLDNQLYFAGHDNLSGDVLWKSDGTAAGTIPVLDQDGQPIFRPRFLQVLDGRVAFTTDSGGLWQTDGTAAGTFEIRKIGSFASELVPAGPRLFFRGYDRDSGTELWVLEP